MVVKDENNIREYVKFRNFVKDNNLSDKKIIQELLFLKQDRIGFIYEKLYNNMIDLLENTRKISDDEKESIKRRLQVYRSLDYVNFQYINELRKIEEENY
jgi:adenylate kinase family enzyme